MKALIERLLGRSSGRENRKFERYKVTAPLAVTIDGNEYVCEIDNVSAGGLLLKPAVEVEVGMILTVTDHRTGLGIRAEVLGNTDVGTRMRSEFGRRAASSLSGQDHSRHRRGPIPGTSVWPADLSDGARGS